MHKRPSVEDLRRVPSPLNTLAFAPSVIPRLWIWLAPRLGVPSEVTLVQQASITPPTCSKGIKGLERNVVSVLLLFCR